MRERYIPLRRPVPAVPAPVVHASAQWPRRNAVSHPGRRPARRPGVVARRSQVAAPLPTLAAARAPRSRPTRPIDGRRHPRAGLRGHRRARHGARAAGTRACSRCLAPVAGEIAVHVDELFEPHPLAGETYLLDDRRHRPRTPGPRRAAARAADRAAVPRRLRRAVPELRRRPQRRVVRLRHRRTRSPVGGPAVARPLRSARSSPMAVPKRKMSRSATRSRKSANMRLAPPGALAVPELRRVAAPAHGVQQLRLVPRPAGHRRRVTRSASPRWPARDRGRRDGRRPRARRDRRGRARGRRRVRRRHPARRAARRDRARICPAARRPTRVEVLAASEVIAMDDDPANAVRTKKDSSLVRCAEAVRDGRAAAMVGAGNTGATMAAALLRLRPHQGRAPPRDRGSAAGRRSTTASQLLVDAGATVDPEPEWLVEWARARARVRTRAPRRRRADDRVAVERRGAGQGRRVAQARVGAARRREGLHRQRRRPRPHAPRRRRDRHRRLHRQRRAEDARRRAAGVRRTRVRRRRRAGPPWAGTPTR